MFALWNGIRVGVITPRVREYRNDVDLRMVGDNVLRRSTTGEGTQQTAVTASSVPMTRRFLRRKRPRNSDPGGCQCKPMPMLRLAECKACAPTPVSPDRDDHQRMLPGRALKRDQPNAVNMILGVTPVA